MQVRRDSMARSNAEANMKSELADFQARRPPLPPPSAAAPCPSALALAPLPATAALSPLRRPLHRPLHRPIAPPVASAAPRISLLHHTHCSPPGNPPMQTSCRVFA